MAPSITESTSSPSPIRRSLVRRAIGRAKYLLDRPRETYFFHTATRDAPRRWRTCSATTSMRTIGHNDVKPLMGEFGPRFHMFLDRGDVCYAASVDGVDVGYVAVRRTPCVVQATPHLWVLVRGGLDLVHHMLVLPEHRGRRLMFDMIIHLFNISEANGGPPLCAFFKDDGRDPGVFGPLGYTHRGNVVETRVWGQWRGEITGEAREYLQLLPEPPIEHQRYLY